MDVINAGDVGLELFLEGALDDLLLPQLTPAGEEGLELIEILVFFIFSLFDKTITSGLEGDNNEL